MNRITDDRSSAPGPRNIDEVYAHVGRRLRHLRTERGLTQAGVAEIINLSPQQYQKYEDAQSKCSLNYLLTLAEYYDVHINNILPVEEVQSQPDPAPSLATMPAEADLLARLVSAFVQLRDVDEKLRLVQLVEAIVSAEQKGR